MNTNTARPLKTSIMRPFKKGIIRPVVLCLLAVVSFAMTSCGSSKEFAFLKQNRHVEYIHIPRFVGLMSKTASPFLSDKTARMAARGFSSMDIVTCEKRRYHAEILEAVDSIVAKEGAELLIYSQEDKEKTTIYGRVDTRKMKVRDPIIVDQERSELSIVRIKGSFRLKDLMDQSK